MGAAVYLRIDIATMNGAMRHTLTTGPRTWTRSGAPLAGYARLHLNPCGLDKADARQLPKDGKPHTRTPGPRARFTGGVKMYRHVCIPHRP